MLVGISALKGGSTDIFTAFFGGLGGESGHFDRFVRFSSDL